MTPRRLSEDVVSEKLRAMAELLGDLARLGEVTSARLETDRLVRHGVERILTQLVELAVAINNHVAAALGLTATSYKESFYLAAKVGMISGALAAELAPSAGMRNVLIHEYVHIELADVARSVPSAQQGYGRYLTEVAEHLSGLAATSEGEEHSR